MPVKALARRKKGDHQQYLVLMMTTTGQCAGATGIVGQPSDQPSPDQVVIRHFDRSVAVIMVKWLRCAHHRFYVVNMIMYYQGNCGCVRVYSSINASQKSQQTHVAMKKCRLRYETQQ